MKKIMFHSKNNTLLNIAPTKVIVLSFAILILSGTYLLATPFASKDNTPTPFIDALFTATSASCVTGLVVEDTSTHWSLFGQIVILAMIQMGGLGIVTLATFFSVLLGRKVSLKGMLLAQESLNHFSMQGVLSLVKRVVIVAFCIEMVGALLLSISFVPKYGPKGFYFGIFHGISAFCNAGFDLIGTPNNKFTSLVDYNSDPIIIFTISGLIIIGGLGFIVWKDLYEYRKTKCLQLHTKIVLISTSLLVILGTIFFFCIEYNNPGTMKDFTISEKINASVFQSVSPRTAGFNSIQIGNMNEISQFATIILMFIGAAPGSTAGGIKVTTFSVIILAIISQIKGSSDTIVLKQKISHNIINKSLAIIGMSMGLVILTTTLLLAFEGSNPNFNINLLKAMFEAVSAFGTVGLTTGITPYITLPSKIILVFAMFLGRVGPVTFAIALALRNNKHASNTIYPDGKIVVG